MSRKAHCHKSHFFIQDNMLYSTCNVLLYVLMLTFLYFCNVFLGEGVFLSQVNVKRTFLSFYRQAVEFLSNEGHIFSTIDEDHYKSTDNDV